MKKNRRILTTSLWAIIFFCSNCTLEKETIQSLPKDYPIALVDFEDYKNLVKQVETHRAKRLINLDTFLAYSKMENTIILDTRSKYRYDRKHLVGAKHLAFTEFTTSNLRTIIPDTTTRILIYCNNNFEGDQLDLASKIFNPIGTDNEMLPQRKPIMLALNIPTYLNLFGYGYRDIYELHELIDVNDPRIQFEGTAVQKFPKIQATQLKQSRDVKTFLKSYRDF